MSDDDRQLLGSIVDNLGVTASLDPDDQITEILIIAKISDFESGGTALGFYHSKGLDWIGQLGLMAAAQKVLNQADIGLEGDDD